MRKNCNACGYQESDSVEKFIQIIDSFFIEKESSWGSPHKEQVSLYACPECKTVILDDSGW